MCQKACRVIGQLSLGDGNTQVRRDHAQMRHSSITAIPTKACYMEIFSQDCLYGAYCTPPLLPLDNLSFQHIP